MLVHSLRKFAPHVPGAERPNCMEPLPDKLVHPRPEDAAPRPKAKQRRWAPKTAQSTSATSVAAPPGVRRLGLTHMPPAPAAPDDKAMLATQQWTSQHLDFLTGTTGQGLALGGVSLGAGGATAGLVSSLAVSTADPFRFVSAAVALLCSCVDIYNTGVNAKNARNTYLATLVLLAEQQGVLAQIAQRARYQAARPEDAALQQITQTVIAAQEAFLAHCESAFFRDAQSPHAQDTRRGLETQAKALVALKAEFDECGEAIQRQQAQLDLPGVDDDTSAMLRGGIGALERRRARLLASAKAVRQDMKSMHSNRRMKQAAKESLASAREALEDAQNEAQLRVLKHGPFPRQRRDDLQRVRREMLLTRLKALPPNQLNLQPPPARPLKRMGQDLPPEFAGPPADTVLSIELLERWDAGDMLPPQTVQALDAARAQIQLPILTEFEAEIAQCERALEEQQADELHIASLQQRVDELSHDLQSLDRGLDKRLLDPFGDRGPAELDRLRDGALSIYKNLLDTAATFNTANGALLHVLPVLFSSLNIIIPLQLLSMVTGVLDVRAGRRGMAQAAAAKLPLITMANHASMLYFSCEKDEQLARKSLQYVPQAIMETAARQGHVFHLLSQMNKARQAYGNLAVANGGAIVVTGVLTLVFGVPVVLGPAVLAGAGGTSYASKATSFLFQLRSEKHHNKQRDAVARAFVRRFGVEGVAELQNDMAAGFPQRWDDRLNRFRQELRASRKGRQLEPSLLHAHALATNPLLNVERLTRALTQRARNGGSGAPSPEAALVSELAQAQGRPDPSTWTLDGFASAQAHDQAVREALCTLLGIPPSAPRTLFKNTRNLKRVADRVNVRLESLLSHRNPLSDDQTLLGWIRAVAKQPGRFGELLEALDPAARQRLREQVAHLAKVLREEGIGAHELLGLQAVAVTPSKAGKPHPLQAHPLLRTPEIHYLLELMADPSWLAEPAPALAGPRAAERPADAAAATTATGLPSGAVLVEKFTSSHKAVGRSMRSGVPGDGQTKQARGPHAMGAPKHRRSWPQRLAHAVRRGTTSAVRQVYELTPNPLATPGQTLKALERLKHTRDELELQLLLQNILLAFAREVGGSDFVLPANPAVALPDGVGPTDAKRAHLRALLAATGEWAGRTSRAASDTVSAQPQAHEALGHVAARMQDTQRLCAHIEALLMNDSVLWGATLEPIQLQPVLAAA